MRKVLFASLFICSMLFIPWLLHWKAGGFKIGRVQCALSCPVVCEDSLSSFAREALRQPFFFLGKGTQCYVFESRDQEYVVKFFRADKNKQSNVFDACLLAYEKLKEETGLVYLHLNKSSLGLGNLECMDGLGRKYLVPMDETFFLLQRKAANFYSVLIDVKDKPVEMKKRIDQFLKLLHARVGKSVRNDDPSLSRNFGFLEDGAVEVDFGSYRFRADLDKKEEAGRFIGKLRRWLKREAPEWVSYLDEQKESLYVSNSI